MGYSDSDVVEFVLSHQFVFVFIFMMSQSKLSSSHTSKQYSILFPCLCLILLQLGEESLGGELESKTIERPLVLFEYVVYIHLNAIDLALLDVI